MELGDAWFTGYSDELARCLVDARACAEACETYLNAGSLGEEELRRAVEVLAAPAAIARVLIELIDQPPQLVLAAVRLCRDLTAAAADELGTPGHVVDSLRTLAGSAGVLLDAAAG